MTRQGNRRIRRVAGTLVLAAPAGCAPTLDVLGVYFPGWLVSTVIGVAGSYGIVAWLGRRPGTRALADSGLFFIGLLVAIVSLALFNWLQTRLNGISSTSTRATERFVQALLFVEASADQHGGGREGGAPEVGDGHLSPAR